MAPNQAERPPSCQAWLSPPRGSGTGSIQSCVSCIVSPSCRTKCISVFFSGKPPVRMGEPGRGCPGLWSSCGPLPSSGGPLPLESWCPRDPWPPSAIHSHHSLQISEKETQVPVRCHSGFASLTNLFPRQTQPLGNQQHFASLIPE